MKYAVASSRPRRAPRTSYGLICVSLLERKVVTILSPPYISQNIYAPTQSKRYHSLKFSACPSPKIIKLNSNQGYDLMLGSFENGFAEGTFALPRGHKENIDGRNTVQTKIREFVEETGLFHPQFRYPATMKLYHNFNEEWIGLNNVHYKANYSVFVIKSMNELINVEKNKRDIISLLYQKNIQNRYRYSIKYDSLKKAADIPIENLNLYLNNNKYKRIVDVDVDRIVEIVNENEQNFEK